MFARMLLPQLGGSAEVWNVAMVFYQASLLAGYGYAHLTTRHLGVRRQTLLHVAVMLLPLIVLPIRLPALATSVSSGHPIWWLLLALVLGVGLPFFSISTMGPLLQRWFADTSHPSASDPYFLYAASNLGSLAGLLSYPFVVEPLMGLHAQSHFWTLGYVVLVLCVVACVMLVRRSGQARAGRTDSASTDPHGSGAVGAHRDEPPRASRRLRWIALAFAPSSLLLGVTLHLSTDIAAIPLLWVVPLAIYLLSFSLAFAARTRFLSAIAVRAFPILLLPLLVVLAAHAVEPLPVIATLHLMVLFAASLACHGALAADRPAPDRLTEFYFWIALGGVLGGVFNAIVAPLVFNSVLEYPLALVLVCLLTPPVGVHASSAMDRRFDVLIPLSLVGVLVGLSMGAARLGYAVPVLNVVIASGLLVLTLFVLSRQPFRFGVGVMVVLIANPLQFGRSERTVFADRSFFGVNRVAADASGTIHRLFNGTTLHGVQRFTRGMRREPTGYYTRRGPAGDVMRAALHGMPGRRVGVAGLGAGSLAAYGAPGQRWDFYEIDPLVERIARDPRCFTFLGDSRADVHVVIGDARLSLASCHARYDLIVLDAYSSDAIPVHLLTLEALDVYLRHLAPGGMLAFHLSNRHLDLEPVVGNLARDDGLATLTRRDDGPDAGDPGDARLPSTWTVVARRRADLAVIAGQPEWKPTRTDAAVGTWTDDYSSVVRVFRKFQG